MSTIAYHIASTLQAMQNCRKTSNSEWEQRHSRRLSALVRQYMPSGNGWDCGTKLAADTSTSRQLHFSGSYHHMDENGCYDGWTSHGVTATPEFDGVRIGVSGSNRNDVKEYLAEAFHIALTQRVPREVIDALYLKVDGEKS